MNQDILNKIQKLLALSNSPNENEALSAAQKASELMLRHHISREDLPDKIEKPVQIEQMVFERAIGSNRNKFNGALAALVSDFFNCKILWYGNQLELIGRREDLDTVLYLYQAFRNQINSLADKIWERGCFPGEHGKSWKHAFRYGMMAKLREKLNNQKSATVNTSSNHSLVVFDSVKKGVENYFSRLKTGKALTSKVTSHSGWDNGYKNGDKLNTNFSNEDRISRTLRLT
ncbi:MAG: DUF2786 domain-containing protein [Candidatus Omnitrophica bacterium]|nr:DUF2786 domain-containing protein [Candidatus Omnitrophota bacterium]